MKRLVSFGCPSKRASELSESIESIFEATADFSAIELIVHVHDDDPETLAVARGLPHQEVIRIITGTRLRGRPDISEFFNRCLVDADALWYWPWSDDMRMISEDYQEQLRSVDASQPWVLYTNGCYSHQILSEPVVVGLHRKPYRSICPDWYIYGLARGLDIGLNMPNLRITHTWLGGMETDASVAFKQEACSQATTRKLHEDIRRLAVAWNRPVHSLPDLP